MLILSDSRLGKFDSSKFSTTIFEVENWALWTLNNVENNLQCIIAREKIDAYVIDVGINDLKNNNPLGSVDRACRIANHLLTYSRAKVIVNLIIPTSNNQGINRKVDIFNTGITQFISDLRKSRDFNGRLFTSFNNAFFPRNGDPIDTMFHDWIHLIEKGLKIHISNIKTALLKSFNIKHSSLENP